MRMRVRMLRMRVGRRRWDGMRGREQRLLTVVSRRQVMSMCVRGSGVCTRVRVREQVLRLLLIGMRLLLLVRRIGSVRVLLMLLRRVLRV